MNWWSWCRKSWVLNCIDNRWTRTLRRRINVRSVFQTEKKLTSLKQKIKSHRSRAIDYQAFMKGFSSYKMNFSDVDKVASKVYNFCRKILMLSFSLLCIWSTVQINNWSKTLTHYSISLKNWKMFSINCLKTTHRVNRIIKHKRDHQTESIILGLLTTRW